MAKQKRKYRRRKLKVTFRERIKTLVERETQKAVKRLLKGL
jgi:hypothetical protein